MIDPYADATKVWEALQGQPQLVQGGDGGTGGGNLVDLGSGGGPGGGNGKLMDRGGSQTGGSLVESSASSRSTTGGFDR